MLAIGRALMGNPSLLLLDEPLEGLAPIIIEALLSALKKLVADESLAIILVEQHAKIALQVTQTALVLNRGRVVAFRPERRAPGRSSTPDQPGDGPMKTLLIALLVSLASASRSPSRPIPRARCASWRRLRPAAWPTCCRAPSASGCRSSSASRSWSRTVPARAATSARTWWRAPSPTATRCSCLGRHPHHQPVPLHRHAFRPGGRANTGLGGRRHADAPRGAQGPAARDVREFLALARARLAGCSTARPVTAPPDTSAWSSSCTRPASSSSTCPTRARRKRCRPRSPARRRRCSTTRRP